MPTTKKRTTNWTPEQKQQWKQDRLDEQKQLVEDAVAELTTSEAWENFVKFGRANLGRLTLNNALLIWSQKRDAKIVWGRKQWLAKHNVNVNADATALRYFAPAGFFTYKDANGSPLLNADGSEKRGCYFRVVTGYDISDTDAPATTWTPKITLEGDEMMDALPRLEQYARLLGFTVKYVESTELGGADGKVDNRTWTIFLDRNMGGNALVHTLVHELAHVYGNVNYKDYSREEAEVIVESAAVMALGLIGYDVSASAVPYIASWSNGDLKALHKYVKLVDELAQELADRMTGEN
jgi:hypothetical protein